MNEIIFFGGDARTEAAVDYMNRNGFSASAYGVHDSKIPDLSKARTVVLPYPCIKDGVIRAPGNPDPPTVEEFAAKSHLSPEAVVIGGPVNNKIFPNYTDLSLREDLKLRNAVTTVEGLLPLMIGQNGKALHGERALILGYGALGKRTAEVLSAIGMKITVAARKEKDRTDAELRRWSTQDTASLCLSGYPFILNTVPVPLISEDQARQAEKNALLIDLASRPGGCTPGAERILGERYRPALALPGRVSPVTAGEDLARTVIAILQST